MTRTKKTKGIKKHKKSSLALFILWIVAIFLFGMYLGKLWGQSEYKQMTYSFCRSFNLMAYLNTETIRFYQNSSFEINYMPNCEVFKGSLKPKLTYQEFLDQSGLKHLSKEDFKNYYKN